MRVDAKTKDESGEVKDVKPSPADVARERLSASQRLEQLRGGHEPEPRIEERVINGEPWYIKRLTWAQLTRAALDASPKRNAKIDMATADGLRCLAMSVLVHMVVKAINDPTPYFNDVEAEAWVTDTSIAVIDTVNDLVNEALNINEAIFPKYQRAATAEKTADSAAASTVTPSNGAPTVLPSGSASTPITAAPVTLPIDSENSESTAMANAA